MSARERVALVTGSGRGIGAAIAAELARTCRTVIGIDLQGFDQSGVARACEAHGARFVAEGADISTEDGVKAAFRPVDELGRLDIVVSNAAIAPASGASLVAAENASVEEWSRVLAVNLTGTFLVCRHAIPHLKRNGWGRIITMSSQTARLASAAVGLHYAASKAGVIAMTRNLALQLAEFGVTANCIAPGLTETRLTEGFDTSAYARTVPLGRLGQPEDVAGAVAYLVSDAASYVTGITLDVNGGKYMP